LDFIKQKLLSSIQKLIEEEVRKALVSHKAAFDLLTDKTSKEAVVIKQELERMVQLLKKGFDIEKIQEKILGLIETVSTVIKNVEFQMQSGFSFEALKSLLLRKFSEFLQKSAKKELENLKLDILSRSEIKEEEKKVFNFQLENLKNLIKNGEDIEMIKELAISKIPELAIILESLDKSYRQGIDLKEVVQQINSSGQALTKAILDTLIAKAGKYLMFALFPFSGPLFAAYEFMTDPSLNLIPDIPDIPPVDVSIRTNMRLKSKNKQVSKYFEIPMDFILNEKNPFIKANVKVQFNAGKISDAFDVIGKMGDYVDKAWNNLKDDARKHLQKVFNVADDVKKTVLKLANDAKQAFNDISDLVVKKAKQMIDYGVLKIKELAKDIEQSMSNLKNVAQAFIEETVVGSLKAVHQKTLDFGKDVLKVGNQLLEKGGELITDALKIKAKVFDKTVQIAADISKGVADVGKSAVKLGEKTVEKTKEIVKDIGKGVADAGKSAVKLGEKALDKTKEIAGDLGKGALKVGGKAVDAVTESAEAVYNFVKFW
jgi:hypothetical protein